MLTAPAKPVQDMTEEELRQWKDWLLDQGLNPRPMKVDLPKSGSIYSYDRSLASVVECTPDGYRFIVEVKDGKIGRARALEINAIADSQTPTNRGGDAGSSAVVALVMMVALAVLIVVNEGIGPNGVRTHPHPDSAQIVTANSSRK